MKGEIFFRLALVSCGLILTLALLFQRLCYECFLFAKFFPLALLSWLLILMVLRTGLLKFGAFMVEFDFSQRFIHEWADFTLI